MTKDQRIAAGQDERFAAIEKEHLGDAEKRTGIYAATSDTPPSRRACMRGRWRYYA